MNDPNNPLGWAVWRRGALLGLQWLAVFVVSTVGVFGLMGALGWSGTLRALCAMCAGPVIAIGVIAAWWMVRRPTLSSSGQYDHRETQGTGEDGPTTR
jgi:hypothetical protein